MFRTALGETRQSAASATAAAEQLPPATHSRPNRLLRKGSKNSTSSFNVLNRKQWSEACVAERLYRREINGVGVRKERADKES